MENSLSDALLHEMSLKYGTPLYVYDSSKIISQIKKLREILPDFMKILYSIKANPSLGIVSYIERYIDGVEVSSEGELFIALSAGLSPDKIIFVGPGKTESELEYAVKENIYCIVTESMEEINYINKISSLNNKVTNIAIRINPIKEIKSSRIKMGGNSKQFGFDEEKITPVLEKIKICKNIKLVGMHVYGGTQNLDEDMLINYFSNVLETARNIKLSLNSCLDFIDFGGGFGIPYFNGEKELNTEKLKKEFRRVFDDNSKYFNFNNMKLYIESGRYLLAESGYFLTKVLYKKMSRGKTYLIVDGGSNNHSSAAGIGRFVRHNFPAFVLNKQGSICKETVDVVGPLCTSTDILLQDVELQECEAGDVIVLPKSGAYGFSASMLNFLSHRKPAEIFTSDGEDFVIREREKKEDIIVGQKKIFDNKGMYKLDKIEDKVRKCLDEIIGSDISVKDIDVEDDLFKMGLDSLNAIKLIVALENEFNFEFNDEDLTDDNIKSISKICNYINDKSSNS